MNTLDDKLFQTILAATLILGTTALAMPANHVESIQSNVVAYNNVSTTNQIATVVVVGKRLPKSI